MDPNIELQLKSLQASKLTWKAEKIMLSVVADDDPLPTMDSQAELFTALQTRDEATTQINLVDYIGRESSRKSQKDGGKRIYLPKAFNENSPTFRKKTLLPHFQKACKCDGFSVRITQNRKLVNGLYQLRVGCSRARTYQRNDEHEGKDVDTVDCDSEGNDVEVENLDKKTRNTSTSKPICKDEKCPFDFLVYFEELIPSQIVDGQESSASHGRWFIYEFGAGCPTHLGHMKVSSSFVHDSIHSVDHDEMEFITSSLDMNVAPAAMRAVLKARTGNDLSDDQIRYARQCMTMNTDGTGDAKGTAADRTIALLRNRPDVSYVVVYDDKPSLLSIPKEPKPRIRAAVRENGIERHHDVIGVPNGSNQEDNPVTYADKIRKSLNVDDSTKVMLMIAWRTTAQLRHFLMFGEASAMDTTMGTNAEKRPLFTCTSKTSDNKIVTWLQIFMPSQCKWAFDTIFRHILPQLFPKEGISRMRMIVTDGDTNEYEPIRDLVTNDKLLTNCKHRLCAWHLIDRGMLQNHCGGGSIRTRQGKKMLAIIKKWIFSWSSSIESLEELEFSFDLLMKYIESDTVRGPQGIGASLCDNLKMYLTLKIRPLDMAGYFRILDGLTGCWTRIQV